MTPMAIVRCWACRADTWQEVAEQLTIPTDTIVGYEPGWPPWSYLTARILKCGGCGAPNLRLMFHDEDDPPSDVTDDDECVVQFAEMIARTEVTEIRPSTPNRPVPGEPQLERQYPTIPVELRRERPYHHLPPEVAGIYREVVGVYRSGLRLMCAIGLRTLLEAICSDKGITRGPDGSNRLYSRIQGLEVHLPGNVVPALHEFRRFGNEAAHQVESPRPKELEMALDLMEDVLQTLYELPGNAGRLYTGHSGNTSSDFDAPAP